jgi:hypothetical protein
LDDSVFIADTWKRGPKMQQDDRIAAENEETRDGTAPNVWEDEWVDLGGEG